jgi:hypothetical protein
MVRQSDLLVVGEALRSLALGKNVFNGAIAYRDGVMLENRARRLYRDDPAWGDKQAASRLRVDRAFFYLGVP